MVPQEAGLYWARSNAHMSWYDLIVQVCGDPPMLYISTVFDRCNDTCIRGRPSSGVDLYWGPMISEPEVDAKRGKDKA